MKGELSILVYTRRDETNYCTENLTICMSSIMNKALARWGLFIVRNHVQRLKKLKKMYILY